MSTGTRTLPATGTWKLDAAHTNIEAVARHLMVTKVRVGFREFEGTVSVAEPVTDSVIDVSIRTASIHSGDDQRDEHLRSPDFLDVEQYPTLRFVSKKITPIDGDEYEVLGDLTVRDVTKPVTFKAAFLGVHTDPWGNAHAAFEAHGELDREEFGVTWNQALETGGVLVSKTVKLDFDVQLIQD